MAYNTLNIGLGGLEGALSFYKKQEKSMRPIQRRRRANDPITQY